MKVIELEDNSVLYIADALSLFIKKCNNTIIGEQLILANTIDNINDYEEKQFSEEEYNEIIDAIYNSIRE